VVNSLPTSGPRWPGRDPHPSRKAKGSNTIPLKTATKRKVNSLVWMINGTMITTADFTCGPTKTRRNSANLNQKYVRYN